MTFIQNRPYTGPVQAVILDWSGTAVDYGSRGPAAVFQEVFKKYGVAVTVEEVRRFMGLMKKDHIRGMCGLPSVVEKWKAVHHRPPDEEYVEMLYRDTETLMPRVIPRYADPIPGLLDAIADFRSRGIRIGSTTGYTGPMVKVLVPRAREKGYEPDSVVCSTDVPAGRPYPWMCYRNAIQLGVYPLSAMVKIGDTLSDIEEGRNAGMWTVGLTQTGNELGLTEDAVHQLPPAELNTRLTEIEQRFRKAGAHYVVSGIWECPAVIDQINERLARGENPLPGNSN
ncbi:MAG: phosphonoacetaldehyde hydrolase [Thermodesulfobacteriota bacterium]